MRISDWIISRSRVSDWLVILFLFVRKRVKKAITAGLFNSSSQSFVLLSSAAAFRYAGYLVQNGEMDFEDVMK